MQKWQCVEDATGKLRLFKCKSDGVASRKVQRGAPGHRQPLSVKSQLYQQRSNSCDCDLQNLLPLDLAPSRMKPFNNKPFFSKKSECLCLPVAGRGRPSGPHLDPVWTLKLTSLFPSEFKALKSYSRNRFSRSVPTATGFPGNASEVGGAHWSRRTSDESEGEPSGMGSLPGPVSNFLKVTHRYALCVCVCV